MVATRREAGLEKEVYAGCDTIISAEDSACAGIYTRPPEKILSFPSCRLPACLF
jgi:hypothetical protein